MYHQQMSSSSLLVLSVRAGNASIPVSLAVCMCVALSVERHVIMKRKSPEKQGKK